MAEEARWDNVFRHRRITQIMLMVLFVLKGSNMSRQKFKNRKIFLPKINIVQGIDSKSVYYEIRVYWNTTQLPFKKAYLASKNLERRIITASQVLCFSCIWMEENFLWMICTMRSISLGVMGRVRDCSLSRFITWVVNSLQACHQYYSVNTILPVNARFKTITNLRLDKVMLSSIHSKCYMSKVLASGKISYSTYIRLYKYLNCVIVVQL